jgi:hypothetical protein
MCHLTFECAALLGSALLLPAAFSYAGEPEQEFDASFGQETRQVAASPDTKDDALFAAKLLKAARIIKDDPGLVALMYEKAYHFGVKNAAGYDAAIEAASLLAELAPDRKGEWLEKALSVCQLDYRNAKTPDGKKKAGDRLLKQMMAVAELRLAALKFSEAAGLYHQAAIVDAPQEDNKEQIQVAIKFAETRQGILRKVEQAKARLEAKPDDRVAAADLVRLYLVELDNPTEATRYVEAAGDESMKRYVLVAGMNLDNLPETGCQELAKWYASLAQGATAPARPRMLVRARACYERFLTLHTSQDAAYAAAKMGLDQVAAELDKLFPPKPPKEIIVEALIDGDSELWVTSKGIYWKNVGKETAKPGRHDGKNEPTYVNGKRWMPEWGKPQEERGFDESKSFSMPIGKVNLRFELQAVGTEKGREGIDTRDAVTMSSSGDALVIRIPDHQMDSRWYRFRLYRP